MSSRSTRTYFVRVLILSLSISVLLSGCKKSHSEEPDPPVDEQVVDANKTIVLQTDSDEWAVSLIKEHLLYSEAIAVTLPAPWRLPNRTEATVLRTLEYPSPSGERFVTSDGYTFGMPSASVSKAGQKTQYSVLGLHRRRTTIDVPF